MLTESGLVSIFLPLNALLRYLHVLSLPLCLASNNSIPPTNLTVHFYPLSFEEPTQNVIHLSVVPHRRPSPINDKLGRAKGPSTNTVALC